MGTLNLQDGDPAGHAPQAPLETVLAELDFLVVTLPLSKEIHGLIGERVFGLMNPGAIFINGAHGAIVEENALLVALDNGRLRAAGLDLFVVEPLPQDSAPRTYSRVTARPHAGSAAHETRHAMAELATTHLLQALVGGRSLACYDTAAG